MLQLCLGLQEGFAGLLISHLPVLKPLSAYKPPLPVAQQGAIGGARLYKKEEASLITVYRETGWQRLVDLDILH